MKLTDTKLFNEKAGYPCWDNITLAVDKPVGEYLKKMQGHGFEVKSKNVLWKDGIYYWVMFEKSGNDYDCWLEAYGIDKELLC